MNTLVIGCTGTVGSSVTRKLLEAGEEVRCFSRSPAHLGSLPPEVDGYLGDLNEPSTLPYAFDDMEALFLLLPVGPHETAQGLAAVNEARNADIGKIVYMSVHMPPGSTHIPHFKSKLPVEEAVKSSGIPYTILRPNNFFQNDLVFKDAILRNRVYPQPIGSVGVSRVDVRDIATAAVNALLLPGHDGMEYPLHGPDALTGEEVARSYSRHLEQEIRYDGDLDLWADTARRMLPAWMVDDLVIMYRYFQEHGFAASPDELVLERKILRDAPRSFDRFVEEVTASWKREMAVSL